jgi:hypothetical protein
VTAAAAAAAGRIQEFAKEAVVVAAVAAAETCRLKIRTKGREGWIARVQLKAGAADEGIAFLFWITDRACFDFCCGSSIRAQGSSE